MPIYEFLCQKCGKHFEALVAIGNEKSASCSSCGSHDIQKLLSTFGIGGGSSRLKSSTEACATCTTNTCSTCK